MTKVEELIHANKIAELLSKKEDEDKKFNRIRRMDQSEDLEDE